MTVCDTNTNMCKGCLVDANCGSARCARPATASPGCNDMQPCQDGLACCDGQCFDLLTDLDHCGGCDACPVPDNAAAVCTMGVCGLGACEGNFNNCDKDPNNGCETDGTCECTPGARRSRATRARRDRRTRASARIGADLQRRRARLRACAGRGPAPGPIDICANNLDDDCNGVVDDNPDEDGDGWTVCGGDCCDAIGPNCLKPELVNPGAFEVPGNMVDDDCDG
jgi:hypothetical protein